LPIMSVAEILQTRRLRALGPAPHVLAIGESGARLLGGAHLAPPTEAPPSPPVMVHF